MKRLIVVLLTTHNQKERAVMKKLLLAVLVLVIGITFASTGSAQAKAAVARSTPTLASGFVGKVTMVGKTMIMVRGKKAAVTFDVTNPQLKGYKSISNVMVGDTVAARYTKDGILITKLKGEAPKKKAGKAKKAAKSGTKITQLTGKVKTNTVVEKKAVKEKREANGVSFNSIICKGSDPCMMAVVKLTEARTVSRVNCTGKDSCTVEY